MSALRLPMAEIEALLSAAALAAARWWPPAVMPSNCTRRPLPSCRLAPQVGLRVMHRTTVQGQYVPRKQNDPRYQRHALQADDERGQQGEPRQQQEQRTAAIGQTCC